MTIRNKKRLTISYKKIQNQFAMSDYTRMRKERKSIIKMTSRQSLTKREYIVHS